MQGIISTGVGLAGPAVERARADDLLGWLQRWGGQPRYLFRSTDNECRRSLSRCSPSSTGQFVTVAGINPVSWRNNMAAFVAMLKHFNIDHKVVTEQWPKVGTMDLTSHVAALKAASPISSFLLCS